MKLWVMHRSLLFATPVMKRRARLAVCLCAVLLLGGLGTSVLHRMGAAPAADAPVQARWEDLVPKEWDPTKRFRDLKLDTLNDSDPRVLQLMRDMRATWDNAPTNSRLDGIAVRLPGYVVPLEAVKGDIKEFLLVPYFGACIHTPPPPANLRQHPLLELDAVSPPHPVGLGHRVHLSAWWTPSLPLQVPASG
jgi:hypothetical protein